MEEAGREETVVRGGGLFYEIRRHATGELPSSSSHLSVGSSSSGGLLSYLSLRGVNRLRERWYEYRRPRSFKRSLSLFVSHGGEHVAVAAGNQITILHRDDDYMEPCGVFTCIDRLRTFTSGDWVEPLGVLGIVDDLNTLYFIRSNGMEIARRTRSQLNLSALIIELFVQKDINPKSSCLCGIHAITEDGLMHFIEITKELSLCTNLSPAWSGHLRLPPKITCFSFHPDLSLAAVVCNSSISVSSNDYSGNYSLYILGMAANSDVELLVCDEKLGGQFASQNDGLCDYSHPKVAISPQGKHVATLDFMGRVDVFKIDVGQHSLSLLSCTAKQHQEKADNMALGMMKCFFDIVDITWWADDILVLASTTGSIVMYDILNCAKVSECDPKFYMPLVESVKHGQGFVFILENSSSAYSMSSTSDVEHKTEQVGDVSSGRYDKHDTDNSCWSLMSLFERSILEMYAILIKSQKYQAALEFASNHCLDTDEVFKAQWLDSSQGIPEINLYLSQINDLMFVLLECVNRVGMTEEIAQALLSHGLRISCQYEFSNSDISYSSSIWNIRMLRLQLLQFRDRLETFVGINMGRFSAQDYCMFRSKPLAEAAIALAETSKIGALNLLFKRHPFSVSPKILDILSSIPETVPIESYCQLLPGTSPARTNALRDADWVECQEMLSFLNTLPSGSGNIDQFFTENLLKLSTGYMWPSVSEISLWYKNRAKEIDSLSGQLNNCLSLVEFGCRSGFLELQQFLEDISYLHQIIYSDGFSEEFTMSLVTWEQLPDYEKFKMMLKGVKEEEVVKRLQETAIPFMQKRFNPKTSDFVVDTKYGNEETFLVRWLKEIALDNHLDLCLVVIENGCGDSPIDGLFKDEVEIIETALYCIYSCTLTDQWNMMASILSKLPRNIPRDNFFVADKDFSPRYANHEIENSKVSFVQYGLEGSTSDEPRKSDSKLETSSNIEKLEKRIKVADGHIEVGRLMAYYQVPKPISFFLSAQSDEKNVKQLLRLILSKFSRRQPARSDNDWASMWRDLLTFQEKAFPFLDLEYILIEFIRGLLKAGKFSLARNYLKGTASVSLTTAKAENLVIQAAREYFFSASSLSCGEIWKAKECLSLFPSSKVVRAEEDMIDALTIRLPNLGVSLLPMQFRQIRNPMEIINMVITSQAGAYLNVEELIEIAKLLGLRSLDDIAAVEEAVAREAAVAGDLPLAFDLCLVLVNKGHGSIWDLCAAIARGPDLDNMSWTSRKQLLGFALSHCDDESIGELLNAWKEVDTHVQSEQLVTLTGENLSKLFSSSLPVDHTKDIFDQKDGSKLLQHGFYLDGVEVQYEEIKDILSKIGKDLVTEDGICWDTILQENKRVLSFAALELPWLLELSEKEEYGKLSDHEAKSSVRHQVSMRMRALLSILSWMAGNNIAPDDDMIKSLAKCVMEPPITEEDDVLGCSFLLNLVDAFHGVEIIEDQLKRRNRYEEIYSIMNIGMIYCSLNNAQKKCSSPEQRRELLLQMFHKKQTSFCSDERDHIDKVQSTFWREWKTKLEEQKRLAEQARELEQIIPGIESARFLSRDMEYIKSALFSFIDSIKLEKKHILKEAVTLADAYGLDRMEVLLHFFACALVSDQWGNNDILAEISEFRNDIVKCADEVITMIRTVVYPEIDGRNKDRLCYMYGILSACCLHLRKVKDSMPVTYQEQGHMHILEPFQFYRVLEQECQRVSFIKDLNFKNVVGLDDLNFEHFNEEICNNIQENTVEALAVLVHALVGIYNESQVKGLISMEGVYRHHVLGILASLEGRSEARKDGLKADELQGLLIEIEMNYDQCKKYVRALLEIDILYVLGRFCTLCFPCNFSRSLPEEPQWKDCLVTLLTFWIKLVNDIPDNLTGTTSKENPLCTATNSLLKCLEVFKRLVYDDEISANQGWETISNYVRHALSDGLISDVSSFLKAMILSGCKFKSITEACYVTEVLSEVSTQDTAIKHLLDIYINLIDKALSDLSMELDMHHDLQCMLSSLSRSAGNYEEDLKIIRSEVWEKLRAFSDNTQIASHTRLYALQLMQCITGINMKSLPAELISDMEPWEGWNASISAKATATSEGADISSNVTSTLIALKSTQLIRPIFPDIDITPENMMTLDSAVSCFLNLSERVTSVKHLSILQVVLEEWEEFFSMKTDREENNESPKESNNWSDEWDEGWEELVSAEVKEKDSVSIRPLHTCWMEIIKRLIGYSELCLVIELLDKSSLKSNNVMLDEAEAHCLFQLVARMDCFMALKFVLLLPYEAPRSQCLHMMEGNLKTGSIPNASSADNYDLLVILLSSGIVRNMASDPSLCKVFSYICYLVGVLARGSQEELLKLLEGNGNKSKQNLPSVFIRVLFPFFISELVCGGQPLIAGFILSRWMHTHICLSLIDVVEASLRRFLEQQILQVQSLVGDESIPAIDSSQSLMYTHSCLRSKLHNQLQSALLVLTESYTR
ncbi:MAG2-interacting protein 2 [Canna indica]|uniref:MAG2-interacting protein 2 n=1 Tax=Canna indica TaxID=4628 RepID=A0AAQ3JST6_9LILI|nr:MAG2-interacting protein 2 [Canna indica]